MFVKTESDNAYWDRDALCQIAERIINSITAGRGVSLAEYQELAASVSAKEIGFSLVWILKNERRLSEFFPDEIIHIISSGMKRYRFDDFADSFIVSHSNMTAEKMGALFFTDRSVIARRAKKLGIKLRRERRHFSPEEDVFIKKYALTDIDFAARTIGVTRCVAVRRARLLGLHVPRRKFIKYLPEELEILKRADFARENDKEMAGRLKNRTAGAVARKRRETGKLRRRVFVWRHHAKKWQYLRANYHVMTSRQIAKKLHLTCSQVEKKAWHEGLRKLLNFPSAKAS